MKVTSLHLLKTQLLDRRARSDRSQTLAGGVQKSKSSILSPAMARTSAGGGIKKSRSTVMNESSPSPRLSSKDMSERQFCEALFVLEETGVGRFSYNVQKPN